MNDTYVWYQELVKPSFAPPAEVFGPVWTFLYLLIIGSLVWTVILYWRGEIRFKILLPFILNLIFNLAFSPIQFGLQNNMLAGIDILLVLGTLIWFLVVIWPYKKMIAYLQLPYLLWVSFATILQLSITYLNW